MVAGLAGLSAGCATSYGPALSNSGVVPSHDLYLYGSHLAAGGATQVTSDGDSEPPASSALKASTESHEKAAKSEEKPSKAAVEHDPEATDAGVEITAGTYRGTDWVTIDLPGFPGSEQVDDKARVVLEKVGDGEYAFKVLDTNSGNELCSIQGTVSDGLIGFELGQSCFGGILGVPMETTLYEGEGRMAGESLEVTLGIELSLTSPDGDDLTGDLSYRFEGKLSEAASPKP